MSIRAIIGRVDEFGVILAIRSIGDLLDTDCRMVTAVVRKLELHIFAGLGAELRRRWFGDRIGPDFGFEFRKRKNKRAQDDRRYDCERNSFHCFAPVMSLCAGRIEILSPQRLKISAPRAFGRVGLSNVFAERRRSAFPSTSTGEARENMSRLFFFFRRCDSLGKE